MSKLIKSKDIDNFVNYTKQPHLEIFSNSQCIVDGLKGIVEYSRDKIKINLGKSLVTFWGDGLYINSFSPDGAIVEGNIISMEFSQYD
jgi:sporulation protein YqfC